jgi:hypothetical protein
MRRPLRSREGLRACPRILLTDPSPAPAPGLPTKITGGQTGGVPSAARPPGRPGSPRRSAPGAAAPPVRAENRIHGSDQQGCSPGAPPVMITGHVPAVRVSPDHANSRVAAAGGRSWRLRWGSSSVVVGLVLSQDRPQAAVTEDQPPVGDLRPGGEHERFGGGVRAGTAGRDHHGFDGRAGKPIPARNQVNVLVAGLHGRCPYLSAVSRTRPGGRTDIWRTGPGAKAGIS